MREYLKQHTNPPVFIGAAVVVLAFLLWGVIAPSSVSSVANSVNNTITTNLEWLYIFSASAFVIFVFFLMLSHYGSIRLGPNDSTPEYGNLSWFAMLFTAGMGIGLVFYAVSEPVTHFLTPPTGEGGTPEAAQNAMTYTFYHWGLHPWSIYIVLGAAMGYFSFRRGLPLRPASALYPLIGNRIYGWPGALVDVLAVFGTLFGLATSLGIGGQQVGAGLNTLFGVPNTTLVQVIIIMAITSVAVTSVMLGIDKGIRNLSLANLWLALALMLFVFFFGPTRDLINVLANNVGSYAQALPKLGFETFPNGGEQAQSWQASWTLFYWGWWISWSPFVGMFLARISYGRTLRSFIAGALFAPVGASMVWLTIFGNSALDALQSNPDNPLADASPEKSIYVLLEQLPVAGFVATIASVVAVLVVVLFFATSSDSGSLVVDILTNGGDPNPKWQQRLFWAVLEGFVAAVLLIVGAVSGTNALSALQTASIVAGLPFCIVLILMAIGLTTSLRSEDFQKLKVKEPPPYAGLRAAAQRKAGPNAAVDGSDTEQHIEAEKRRDNSTPADT
ncbi:BCCT family transporter [Janibacter cremeus]|uniref:Choline/glycine/proline betaine transport protein n=1 Tax=Janibacter cremeus TaxID=1285192 RepID=A0A852VNJ0_9MICO|nr:BCCT family transporter [Janibacter cremeus]NYF97499.1 choline/glycine/proline betaine transport protein [Janibacter cremeus]